MDDYRKPLLGDREQGSYFGQPGYPVPGMPQAYGPPPAGQPYYPQSGTSHPASSYQASGPPQNQQQVVVVGSQPAVTPVIVSPGSSVSFGGAIVLSCLVFWFCGWLFGGIAFLLALVGQSNAESGDVRSAIQMRKASYGVSVAGIVVAVVVIVVVIGVTVSARYRIASHVYYYHYKRCSSGAYYYVCTSAENLPYLNFPLNISDY